MLPDGSRRKTPALPNLGLGRMEPDGHCVQASGLYHDIRILSPQGLCICIPGFGTHLCTLFCFGLRTHQNGGDKGGRKNPNTHRSWGGPFGIPAEDRGKPTGQNQKKPQPSLAPKGHHGSAKQETNEEKEI